MDKKNNRQWLIALIAALVGLLLGVLCGAIGGGAVGYLLGRGNPWRQSSQELLPERGSNEIPVLPEPTPRNPIIPFPEGLTKGALIVEVVPGTPAERAGLQPGDIIVSVDGREIGPDQQLSSLIQQYGPGDRVMLAVRRGLSETIRVNVQLVENPQNPAQGYLGVRVQNLRQVAP